MKALKRHPEGKETPQMEASYHSPRFLAKAARLARKKSSKRR